MKNTRAIIFLLLLTGYHSVFAAEVLRVLAWPGYADPDAVKLFEKQTGAQVEVTQIDSDDVLWKQVSSGQNPGFDVFAVNTAELARYIDAGLVMPIDRANLPNTRKQVSRFRDVDAVPGIVKNNTLYAIPYTYADMGLIYDKKVFLQPPTTISVMWDTRFRGRVLAYDSAVHNFSLAAIMRGSHTPFHIDTDEWQQATADLIALRRNVLAFYSQPEEALKLYRDNNAVVLFANYGSQQLQTFKNAGFDVGYTIPKEGALAWLDCWAITAHSSHKKLAEAWINLMLDPIVSNYLVERQGLSSTLVDSASQNTDVLYWLQPPEDVNKRTRLWKRIISGDRLNKVLSN